MKTVPRRALMLALAGECDDELLRAVSVDSVEPMGSASQLLVKVRVPADLPAMEVIARLNMHVPKLRALVAAAICRKRVPMLSFIAVPEGGSHE